MLVIEKDKEIVDLEKKSLCFGDVDDETYFVVGVYCIAFWRDQLD